MNKHKEIHSLKRINDWISYGNLKESNYIVVWTNDGTLQSNEIKVFWTPDGFSYESEVDFSKREFDSLMGRYDIYFKWPFLNNNKTP